MTPKLTFSSTQSWFLSLFPSLPPRIMFVCVYLINSTHACYGSYVISDGDQRGSRQVFLTDAVSLVFAHHVTKTGKHGTQSLTRERVLQPYMKHENISLSCRSKSEQDKAKKRTFNLTLCCLSRSVVFRYVIEGNIIRAHVDYNRIFVIKSVYFMD